MASNSIVHDADASDNHATSSQASDDSESVIEAMRFLPQWIGCQRSSRATISSISSFQCHSPPPYPVSEWGTVEAFEQEVSVCFLPPPDAAFELDATLRTRASCATLHPSGTVTPTPHSIARKKPDRTRPSSFLNFNIGNIFRLPVNSISNNNNNNNIIAPYYNSSTRPGSDSSAHLPPPPPSELSQDQSHNQYHYSNHDLVSFPSASSASVSTYASASAFTVASNPSISTYASASASMSPSSASKSQRGRKSRGARSHISSLSWSYSYPYSDYMSSTSGLSIQNDNYHEDMAAGVDIDDDDRNVETEPVEEPTSPTTTTASTTTTTSISMLSSPSPSRQSNLVRRFRLRGGADEHFLKPRSATTTGIQSSSAPGVTLSSKSSSPSPSPSPVSLSASKTPFKSRFLITDKVTRAAATDDEDPVYPRPNPNSRQKKRLIFVELDEEGRMVENRWGAHAHANNNNRHHYHNNHVNGTGNGNGNGASNGIIANDTIGKSTSNTTTASSNQTSSNPLAIAAEHLTTTLSNNPFFQLRFRKQKRLLVKDIPTDDGDYTRSRIVALRQWAESLGAVRRLLRSIPDGTIWIEFKDREVAENVCHLHAHVHIPNVGRVRLDWVEGREAG